MKYSKYTITNLLNQNISTIKNIIFNAVLYRFSNRHNARNAALSKHLSHFPASAQNTPLCKYHYAATPQANAMQCVFTFNLSSQHINQNDCFSKYLSF